MLPSEIPDALYEQCLRALHFAPPDKPSRALLEDMCSVDPEALRDVIAIAFKAGLNACTHDGLNGRDEFELMELALMAQEDAVD